MTTTTPSAAELHLVYVLLDSNLPTGGFVSSSGLESYAKHGFLTAMPAYEPAGSDRPAKVPATKAIMDFSLAELDNYASTTLCFVADAWSAVHQALVSAEQGDVAIAQAVASIEVTDELHESTLLSHVARRSSKAQGVAMLTLYSRGLSQPGGVGDLQVGGASDAEREIADGVVERTKRLVRAGRLPGHLATCWGVITAALGLPLGEQHSFISSDLS
jgi:urease accessory protein